MGLGLSLGVGKQDNEMGDMPFSIAIMGRLQYRATQLKLGDMLYPFAYLDAGVASYMGDFLIFSPNVGLCLEINDKHSVDVVVGYTKQDDSGALRLAVGYDF